MSSPAYLLDSQALLVDPTAPSSSACWSTPEPVQGFECPMAPNLSTFVAALRRTDLGAVGRSRLADPLHTSPSR